MFVSYIASLLIFSPYLQPFYLFATLINMLKMLPTPSSAKKTTSSDSTVPLSITHPYSTKLIEEIGYICLHLLTSHLLCNSKQLEQECSPEIILADEYSPNKKIKMVNKTAMALLSQLCGLAALKSGSPGWILREWSEWLSTLFPLSFAISFHPLNSAPARFR